MLRMISGVVDGLYHLHMELQTSNISKPAIAHRDMKTKNILVKLDGKLRIFDNKSINVTQIVPCMNLFVPSRKAIIFFSVANNGRNQNVTNLMIQ